MRRAHLPLSAARASVALLSLALVGCGSVSERLGESVAEQILEEGLGSEADVRVDADTGEVDITVGDGSFSTGDREIPQDIAEVIALPEDFEVVQVAQVDGDDRGALISIRTPGDLPDVVEALVVAMTDLGWSITLDQRAADGATVGFEGPSGFTTLIAGVEGDQVLVNYSVSLQDRGEPADGAAAGNATASTDPTEDGAPKDPVALVAQTVTPDQVAADVTWGSNALDLRGQDGTLVAFDCPAGGTIGNIWGDGIYTDDSSVCTAGVHAGVITLADGGRVVIEIAPGQESYDSSEANGVSTGTWPSWDGSFTVPVPR